MLTAENVSRAYGISTRSVYHWRDRAGVSLEDFRDPQIVATKLAAAAVNRSPRLEKLKDKGTQMHIVFRLAVAGAIEQIL